MQATRCQRWMFHYPWRHALELSQKTLVPVRDPHARWGRPTACGRPLQLARGAKSQASNVKDLPQGSVGGQQAPEREESARVYPQVIQGALNNMTKFSNCVVLTRMGNFYEACESSDRLCSSITDSSAVILRPGRALWPLTQSQGRLQEDHQWPGRNGEHAVCIR